MQPPITKISKPLSRILIGGGGGGGVRVLRPTDRLGRTETGPRTGEARDPTHDPCVCKASSFTTASRRFLY